VAAALTVGICAIPRIVEASDPKVSMTVTPVRYIFVDGDSGKFRELHWTKEGYIGGLSAFSGHHAFANGVIVDATGHALIDQNDLGAGLALNKEDLGVLTLDFSEFRKYFDNNGGVYHLFPVLTAPHVDRDLELDIGKLAVKGELTVEGLPDLSLFYERRYKDGTKTKLTWGEAEETPASGNATRNIVPAWFEIDEIVDTFEVGVAEEIAGVAFSGEQHWEFVRAETLRDELDRSTTFGLNDDREHRDARAPESTLMTTTLRAERSFQDDSVFVSSAYRFAHMNNREHLSIRAYNALTGARTESGHNHPDSRADNRYETHTWVGNVSVTPLEHLTVLTAIKAEMLRRESNSIFREDTSDPPDGVADDLDRSWSDNKTNNWGEKLSIRYTGIPRTALYTDLELEQGRTLLREEQAVDHVWERETVGNSRRGAWTLGGNVVPWPFLNVTAQVRRWIKDQDLDDQRETLGGLNSAFIDSVRIHRNEFTTRATYRPCRWFRSSFRYQLQDEDYGTIAQAESLVKTSTDTHTYTYDVSLEPRNDLLMTGSFSRQTASFETLARFGSTGATNIPTFNADVNTWMWTVDYAPKPQLSTTSSLLYTMARNFNDFTAGGIPYGADFDQLDLTTGLNWALGEDASLQAEYGYYHYQANSNAGTGDYDAHMISFELSKKF